MDDRPDPCPCGHEPGVHDAYGCAAWLPAYAETAAAGNPPRCTCRIAHHGDDAAERESEIPAIG